MPIFWQAEKRDKEKAERKLGAIQSLAQSQVTNYLLFWNVSAFLLSGSIVFLKNHTVHVCGIDQSTVLGPVSI